MNNIYMWVAIENIVLLLVTAFLIAYMDNYWFLLLLMFYSTVKKKDYK